MPFWSGNNPIAFSPASIEGLVAWYDSNSLIRDLFDNNLFTWNDKSPYRNNLFVDLTDNSNAGDNLSNNLLLSNVVFRSIKPAEFKIQPSGATIFSVINIQPLSEYIDLSGVTENIVNLFGAFDISLNLLTPRANFTLNMLWNSNPVLSNHYFIQGYDLTSNSIYDLNNVSTSDLFNNFSNNIFTGICINKDNSTNINLTYYNGGFTNSNSYPIEMTKNPQYFNIHIGDSSSFPAFDTNSHTSRYNLYEVIIFDTILSESNISLIHKYLQKRWDTPTLCNGGNFNYI
jgi:hypothetical protein